MTLCLTSLLLTVSFCFVVVVGGGCDGCPFAVLLPNLHTLLLSSCHV